MGLAVYVLLVLALPLLKLASAVSWPWSWVMLPLWAPWLAALAMGGIGAVIRSWKGLPQNKDLE